MDLSDAIGTSPGVALGVGDGDLAVQRATSDGEITTLILVNAALSASSVELIGESDELAVLTVVDPAERDVLAAAIDGHLASPHEDSDILVGPVDPDAIKGWLAARTASAMSTQHVELDSAGGWRLHADLLVPSGSEARPAIVLMHSGRSDRSIFARLARLLCRRGFVVLNVDWRGRGMSTNRGRFIDFTRGQQAEVRHDVVAAYDFLAGNPRVTATQLGVLGIAHGAGYAASGALGDPRTKAIVLLTGFHTADDDERAKLVSGDVEVLYITGTPHRITTESMRALYEVSRGRRTRFIEYPEGVLGYQLFDLHPDLEPTIVAWFAEVLLT